jgi:sarcosine oxidase, subunit alpha
LHLTDLTSAFAVILLAGPRSTEVLKTICPLRLDGAGLIPGLCAQAPVARVNAIVMREDYEELKSYLILVSRDYGEYVWKSIMSAGGKHDIRQFGLTAEQRLTQGSSDAAAVQ